MRTAPLSSTLVICIEGDFILRYVNRICRWMLSTDWRKSQKYLPVALIMSSYLEKGDLKVSGNILSVVFILPKVTEKSYETSPEEDHKIIVLFALNEFLNCNFDKRRQSFLYLWFQIRQQPSQESNCQGIVGGCWRRYICIVTLLKHDSRRAHQIQAVKLQTKTQIIKI